MPARASFSRVLRSADAGPMVQTILVLGCMGGGLFFFSGIVT